MDKFDELLQKLNAEKRVPESLSWEDNVPSDIYNEMFDDMKQVDEIVEESNSKYVVSTVVIKVFGRYLGITYVSELHNFNIDISDCLEYLEFNEMKEKNTRTFVKKKTRKAKA